MKLLTKAILQKLPPLYSQDGKKPEEVLVPVKFFHPMGSYTFYATEYDPERREFFGYTVLHENELGYQSLDELEGMKIRGLKVERDMYWNSNTTLKEVIDSHV